MMMGDSPQWIMALEVKKGDYHSNRLEHQLFANLMLASVIEFINTLNCYNKNDIKGVLY